MTKNPRKPRTPGKAAKQRTRFSVVRGASEKEILERAEREQQDAARARLLRCPSWLDKRAREMWKTLAPLTEQTGWLKPSTKRLLAIYCAAHTLRRRADARVRKLGRVKVVRGVPQRRFELIVIEITSRIAIELSDYLGMNPAARARRARRRAEQQPD